MSSAQLEKFAQIKPADIEWREGLPFSREFDDIYFSPQDGLAESEYVFLDGNQLPDDWNSLEQNKFYIGELGFGSGLNFLITAARWAEFLQSSQTKSQNSQKSLHFMSIEKRPMTKDDFILACEYWPQFKSFSQHIIQHYPSLTFGRHQIEFPEINLTLTLFFMPVEQALDDLLNESLAQENKTQIDHWYLDGFAPAKNSSMWATDVIHKIACLSKIGTRVATFSVAASIKNPLIENGFEIKKRKGFGRKREMLTAVLVSQPENKQRQGFINLKFDKPWFDICRSHSTDRVVIIGGGIAGCALAYELTQKGICVDIFEEGNQLASGASGAAAGIFHPQLTSDLNLGSQLHWQAYLIIIGFLESLSEEERSSVIVKKGIQRIANSVTQQNQLLQLSESIGLKDWISDFESALPSIFFADACALDMSKLCSLLINRIDSKLINLNLGSPVTQISPQNNDAWTLEVKLSNGETKSLQDISHIVYCGGNHELIPSQFKSESTHWTRGQTCTFSSAELAGVIDRVICEQLYIVPQGKDEFLVGSTFDDFKDDLLRKDSRNSLLDRFEELLTKLEIKFDSKKLLEETSLSGQVGYRLHTQDRLPLVGPVVNQQLLESHFANLGQKRIAWQSLESFNQPGLWLNTGFGSHGLLISMIAAKHLCSMILNDISPIPNAISNRLHPARFSIKKVN